MRTHIRPSYAQIRESIREQILAGNFDAQRQLPTEPELQQRFQVSRQTIRRAMQDLVSEGLIQRFSGRGTYITGLHQSSPYVRVMGDIEDIVAFSKDTQFEVFSSFQIVYEPTIAKKLCLPSSQMSMVRGRRIRDGKPLGVWSIYVPPDIAFELEQREVALGRNGEAIFVTLEHTLGYIILKAEQVITATAADEYLSQVLSVPVNTPLLRIERIYYESSGRPIEVAISEYLPSLYEYRIDLYRAMSSIK